MSWRATRSRKPGPHYGNAYVLNGDTFVITIHRGSVESPIKLAQFLAEQFNKREAKDTGQDPRTEAERKRDEAEREALQAEALRATTCVHVFRQSLGHRNRVCVNCGVVEFNDEDDTRSFRERLGLGEIK